MIRAGAAVLAVSLLVPACSDSKSERVADSSNPAAKMLLALDLPGDIRPLHSENSFTADGDGLVASAVAATVVGDVYVRVYETSEDRREGRAARNAYNGERGIEAWYIECDETIIWFPRDVDHPALLKKQETIYKRSFCP